ncbi:hypothetical protein [Micropruina sp.]|uniref:hypothetical protein n=1 Tax=Micropruina sp. TaxID=2737536 RepID=UPI0039E45691
MAWLLLVGSAATLLLVVADTAILGHYDTGELAVMARAAAVFVFVSALVAPLGTAVQIVVAQWVGTVFLALCTALVALPVLLLPGWYLLLYTVDPAVAQLTSPCCRCSG